MSGGAMRIIKNGLTVTMKGKELEGKCDCGCVTVELFDNVRDWSFDDVSAKAWMKCPECRDSFGVFFEVKHEPECSPA